ncbi:MAG: hypothetical protein WC100_02430 [Sterolibacterium sp.]
MAIYNDPEELNALADRIDFDEQWRRSPLDDSLTQAEKDRMWAGVHLRRYAHDRGNMLEELKEGAQYIRGMRLERANRGTDQRGCGDNAWHDACNAESDRLHAATPPGHPPEWERILHTARKVSDEVPRMVLLFERERTIGMPSTYKMCGHDPRPATPLPDNHLACALRQECGKCPHLAAIDRSETMTPEAKDEAKAWTCATHFLLESDPDVFFEGILHDKSDAAFNARLVESFGAGYDDGILDDGN